MTRTTAAVIAAGSALVLSACSSHSGSSASPTTSATTAAASVTASVASASATATASGAPVAGSSAPGGSAAPSAGGASGAASSTPAATIPATVTSPGSTPTATTSAATSAATASTTATSAAAGSSTRCRNGQLKVSLGTRGGAAGSVFTALVFTNTGSTSCTLAGHPGVSYVAGDKGVQVGNSASRDPGRVATVTLAPGGAASAVLREVTYQNFDQSACKPVTTRGLRVYPPGSTAAFFLPRVAKECSGTKLPGTALSIGVLKPGTNPGL